MSLFENEQTYSNFILQQSASNKLLLIVIYLNVRFKNMVYLLSEVLVMKHYWSENSK